MRLKRFDHVALHLRRLRGGSTCQPCPHRAAEHEQADAANKFMSTVGLPGDAFLQPGGQGVDDDRGVSAETGSPFFISRDPGQYLLFFHRLRWRSARSPPCCRIMTPKMPKKPIDEADWRLGAVFGFWRRSTRNDHETT